MDAHNQTSYSSSTANPEDTQGRTIIAEAAVAKVVGVAVRGVAGVHAVGSGASRSLGAIREVVGAADLTQGVRVEVGESEVAVDIVLLAEYGYPLQALADTVRRAVYAAVQEFVGRSVIEVNIEITDVFIPVPESERSVQRPRLAGRLGAPPVQPPAPNSAAILSPRPTKSSNNPMETGEQL